MALLDFVTDVLFGKPKAPKMDEAQLERLLQMGIDENRYDQYGLFTNNTWDAGKDALTTSVSPDIQQGFEGLLARVNEGSPGYEGAGRFEGLLNAMNFGQQPERRPPPERKERPMMYRPRSSYPNKYGPPEYLPEDY